jgi:hypothetical protein
MSNDTDRARELLERATAPEPDCTCDTPHVFHETACPWFCWMYDQPRALHFLGGRASAILALAIKQHESLRSEHKRRVYNTPWHLRAVENRDYLDPVNVAGCFPCLMLLQWEQMWEEKKD